MNAPRLTFASLSPIAQEIYWRNEMIELDGSNGKAPLSVSEGSGIAKKTMGKRARNKELALAAICEAGEITNQKLAIALGVSGQTSGTYIDELENDGLVSSSMVRFEGNIRRRLCRPTNVGRNHLLQINGEN